MDTKNWIYSQHAFSSMTDGARELALFMENDRHLWMERRLEFWQNLNRKEQRGIFDADKAVVLMGYFVKEAAESYGCSFDKSDREQVAKYLVCLWNEEVMGND